MNEMGMVATLTLDPLGIKNVFRRIATSLSLMPSIKYQVIRRDEAGIWIRKKIEEGYNKGSWEKIKQSDSILIKAWKVKK